MENLSERYSFLFLFVKEKKLQRLTKKEENNEYIYSIRNRINLYKKLYRLYFLFMLQHPKEKKEPTHPILFFSPRHNRPPTRPPLEQFSPSSSNPRLLLVASIFIQIHRGTRPEELANLLFFPSRSLLSFPPFFFSLSLFSFRRTRPSPRVSINFGFYFGQPTRLQRFLTAVILSLSGRHFVGRTVIKLSSASLLEKKLNFRYVEE